MLDILSWSGEQNVSAVILSAGNLSDDFFDLSTGLAGEILQKCSNYDFRLAIVGELSTRGTTRFRDLAAELNRGCQVRFVVTRGDAVEWLARVIPAT